MYQIQLLMDGQAAKDTLVGERGLGLHEATPEVAAEEAGATRVLQLDRGLGPEKGLAGTLACSGRLCRRRKKSGVGGVACGIGRAARPRVGDRTAEKEGRKGGALWGRSDAAEAGS